MSTILDPDSISTPIITSEVKIIDQNNVNSALSDIAVYPHIDIDYALPPGYFCCCVICCGIGKCCGKSSYDCVRVLCCSCCISPTKPTWNRKFDLSVSIVRNALNITYPHRKFIPFVKRVDGTGLDKQSPSLPGIIVTRGKPSDGFLASQGHEWLYPKNEGFPDFSVESNKNRRFILFIHGGAFVLGSPGTHRLLVADLVRTTGATALSIQYRRAPDWPYPAAELDGLEAFKYLSSKVDSSRIVLAGDSAGGALCIAVMARIRDLGLPRARGAILLSPYVDYYKNDTESCRVNCVYDFIPARFIPVAGQMYVDPPDNRVAPTLLNLKGLPPLLVEIGESEVLRDVILDFVEKAINAGVDVEHNVYTDMIHVFQLFRVVSNQDQAVQSLKNIEKFMNRIFSENSRVVGDIESQGSAVTSPVSKAPQSIGRHVYTSLNDSSESMGDVRIETEVKVDVHETVISPLNNGHDAYSETTPLASNELSN